MWGIGVTLIALNESPSEKEGKSSNKGWSPQNP